MVSTELRFSQAAPVSSSSHLVHRSDIFIYRVAFLIVIAFPSQNPVSDGVLIIHLKKYNHYTLDRYFPFGHSYIKPRFFLCLPLFSICEAGETDD